VVQPTCGAGGVLVKEYEALAALSATIVTSVVPNAATDRPCPPNLNLCHQERYSMAAGVMGGQMMGWSVVRAQG
jgi:hypothetical protein